MTIDHCPDCNAMISTDAPGVGHRPGCSKSTDTGTRDEHEQWLATRPPHILEAIKRCPADRLYRNKPACRPGYDQLVYILAYCEPEKEGGPVTLRVGVSLRFNYALAFEREVFGVSPDDLEPIDETVDAVAKRIRKERGGLA